MKKYLIIIAGLLLLTAIACKKYKESRDDLAGDYYLSGRLYLNNTLGALGTDVPVPQGVVIKLGITDKDNNLIYINEVTTDKDGYFLLQNLKKTDYKIYAEYATDSMLYVLSMRFMPESSATGASYVMTPSEEKQNGIVYTVTTPDGLPAASCNVCMFKNTSLANDGCTGNAYTRASNAAGVAIARNIAPGKYIAYIKLEAGNVKYAAFDTTKEDVPQYGFIRRNVKLLATTGKAKGLQFVVRDTVGGIIKDCTVCLFTSSALANDSCNGHYASKSTGADGKVMFDALPVGNIYSYFKITAGSKTLKANVVVSYADTGLQVIDTVRVR